MPVDARAPGFAQVRWLRDGVLELRLEGYLTASILADAVDRCATLVVEQMHASSKPASFAFVDAANVTDYAPDMSTGARALFAALVDAGCQRAVIVATQSALRMAFAATSVSASLAVRFAPTRAEALQELEVSEKNRRAPGSEPGMRRPKLER
jgi:hypothetical protein